MLDLFARFTACARPCCLSNRPASAISGALGMTLILLLVAFRPTPDAWHADSGIRAGAPIASDGAKAESTTVVVGRLRGWDDRPLDAAHMSLGYGPTAEMGDPYSTHRPVGRSGRFTLELSRPGAYQLELTGARHQKLRIPLLARPSVDTLRLEVELGTHERTEPIDSVRLAEASLVSEKSGGTLWSAAHPLRKRSDGTYSAIVPTPSDTLSYQILGVGTGWAAPMGTLYPLEGTQAKRIALAPEWWDANGANYVSIVRTRTDSSRITFDPDRLPPSDQPPEVSMSDPVAQRLARVHLDYQRREQRARRLTMENRAAGNEDYVHDYARMRKEWRQKMEQESDRLAWAYRALLYFGQMRPTESDSSLARDVFNRVSPTSPAWSVRAWSRTGVVNLLQYLGSLYGRPQQAEDYFERMYKEHPDPRVQLQAVARAIRHADNSLEDQSKVQEHYRWFARRFPEAETRLAEDTRQEYSPDRSVQAGAQVPDFSFASMEDSTAVFTDESLRGQVYLIDVWAVWCAPCIEEMPALHETHEKYADDGFTILSISYDRSRRKVRKFRKEKWRMPWKHVYAGFAGDGRQRVDSIFGVAGIPHKILVDKDGTIVAVGRGTEELGGEQLKNLVAEMVSDGDASEEDAR